MGKLKLKISPLFIIFAFIVIYFGWFFKFLVYLITLVLHEFAHYFTAKIYGYKLNKIIFMPYGASLSGESNIFEPKHEIIIALAGPILNLILVFLCVALWWLVPITYAYTDTFVMANIALGMFNFLPIFPLDGGRVLLALFGQKFNKLKLLNAMKIIGLTFTAFFTILFVLSVFWQINFTYIFIAFFLFISSVGNVSSVYYERTHVQALKTESFSKPIEIKTYAVSQKMPLVKLLKYIKGNNFTQFIVFNEDQEIVEVLTETDIKKLLLKNKN